jgi:hypothetical protein
VIDGALLRDVDARWQSARTMAETLRLQGKAPIDLDWEVHEDATVRTDSFFESQEDRPPALLAIGDHEPNIEIDIELTGGRPAVTDASSTIRTEPPRMPISSRPPPRRGSGLWFGVLLGVLVTAAVAIVAGYFLVYPRLSETARSIELTR